MWQLCHVIWSYMLTIYHSPAHLFSPVKFFFSSLCQLEWLSHLQQGPVLLPFPLPGMVITTDATPSHWAFLFSGFWIAIISYGSWSDSICKAHIALHELQTVAMMLCRLALWLSYMMVVLCLDNSTAKAYLCDQGGTVSPFQTGLLDIESDHQAQYYSYSSIHSYPPECGSQLSVTGIVASSVASSFSHCPSSSTNLGSTRGGPAVIIICQSMSALLHL